MATDRFKKTDIAVLFKADADARGKIGLRHEAALAALGKFFEPRNLVTRRVLASG